MTFLVKGENKTLWSSDSDRPIKQPLIFHHLLLAITAPDWPNNKNIIKLHCIINISDIVQLAPVNVEHTFPSYGHSKTLNGELLYGKPHVEQPQKCLVWLVHTVHICFCQ